jgi:hypothetical protein
LWRFRVLPLAVADLSTEERLERAGLGMPVPGRKTWPAYQQVGETLWSEGWPGLMAPSAARPSGCVVCLFVAEVGSPARPVGRPRKIGEPPIPPAGMRT